MSKARKPLERKTGVFAPLFSVHSARSAGVGDFEDLKRVVDWCALTGQSIIQLLPMNDRLTSVYAPSSLFALEPQYIAMERLIGVDQHVAEFAAAAIRRHYPAGQGYVDYAVKGEKLRWLYELYAAIEDPLPQAYYTFVLEQEEWLHEYALYKTIKREHSEDRWETWDEPLRDRHPAALADFERKHAKKIRFFKWLQWQLFEQFREAKAYAESRNVSLMGDFFYIVMSDSVDTWASRDMFQLDRCPGLPPEPGSPRGQRWDDQPVYNWKRMQEDGYRFLTRRVAYQENFFHILRIDHISSFFRVWSIPTNEPWETLGLNGRYEPSTYSEWEEQGRAMLAAMQLGTSMALCAENLGPFTTFFTPAVRDLGIPIINFQRWEKDYDGTCKFKALKDYDELTMITLSNHDTSCWTDWWENEAGTVEESWFREYCGYLDLHYETVRDKLFNLERSAIGKLRWRDDVDTVDVMLERIQRHAFQVAGLIHRYYCTFQEREQLVNEVLAGIAEPSETDSRRMLQAAMIGAMRSNAVFCAHSIIDWLAVLGLVEKEAAAEMRISRPGIADVKDWSLTIPIPLEKLLEEAVVAEAKQIVEAGQVSKVER
ncbi:4-alpha-glucanotransferase [Paenibacillus sp. MMS18-CY102]|uniref:4-alpha-glucanotransferase n=1 Tax=Paenibacillus sp. MMS18-CY102 TaxID=2682849 RepID=UPI001365FEA8|nr:4-alpha-glucanotransferase [Paenibacillus sp. MMS18-CY102]MWC28115.1 hypothetical protein [Paenibacillus sp. MMS18-CY102]